MKKVSEKRLTSSYREFLKDNKQFEEVYDIASKNSTGNVWLIGGYIYRNLVRMIYGEESVIMPPGMDIDFLLEGQNREPYQPPGWSLRYTSYGNPYFVRGEDERTDLNNLPNFSSILLRKLKPTLTNFLTGAPLTIQAIAYDCTERHIITRPVCISAMNQKTVRINNLEMARIEARRKGTSIERMLATTAKDLGFAYKIK